MIVYYLAVILVSKTLLLDLMISGEVICQAQTPSRCIYASPQGEGAGTFIDPASLKDALAQAAAGDFVYLRGGVYTDYVTYGNGNHAIMNLNKNAPRALPLPTIDRPLVITGYPDEEAVIRGDFSDRCVVVDRRSHYIFSHFKVERCLNEGIRLGLDIPQQDIVFDGIEVSNIRYQDNSGFLTIHSYENVVIRNSLFHDYDQLPGPEGFGFYIKLFGGKDILIINNEFYGAGSGIYYKHGESTHDGGGYTRIYQNTFHDLVEELAISSNQNRTEIKGNLMLNADVSIHHEDGTQEIFTNDIQVEYNTFIDSRIILNQGSDTYIQDVQLGAFNANVSNNIILDSDYIIWPYGPDSQFLQGVGLNSNHNCLFNSASNFQVNYFGADGSWGDEGGIYTSAQWQQLGFDTQSQFVDPMLDQSHIPSGGAFCSTKGHSAFRCEHAGSSHPDWVFCGFFEAH